MPWVRRTVLLAMTLPVIKVEAQARPSGTGRPWVELDAGAGKEQQHCTGCARTGRIGGLFLALGAGVSVTQSLGLGLVVRQFEEGAFETDVQESRYLLAVGQYSPPILGHCLALHVGAGEGWHYGSTSPGRFEQAPITENSAKGTALSAGLALRVPSGSTVALAITADVTHTVTGHTAMLSGGATSYRPTLVSVGVGLSVAGKPIT